MGNYHTFPFTRSLSSLHQFDWEVSSIYHLKVDILPSVVSVENGKQSASIHISFTCHPFILRELADDPQVTEPLNKWMQERKACICKHSRSTEGLPPYGLMNSGKLIC